MIQGSIHIEKKDNGYVLIDQTNYVQKNEVYKKEEIGKLLQRIAFSLTSKVGIEVEVRNFCNE